MLYSKITVIQAVIEKFGKIDVLVNSAGITGITKIKTHKVDPANFDKVMKVNLYGVFNYCQAVLPHMLEKNYGRIVNIASISGKEGNVGMLAYSTSKAAVIGRICVNKVFYFEGFTKVVGKEYAETGITCNAIAPAVIETPLV
jgi:NAD(P)-dependent dehydrogenase (short-subunit alcohol dehydrogenase family)